MTRRITILVFMIAVVGFGIAVQRDTFLRRWLLPVPRATPTPLLDTRVPEINFVHPTLGESVGRLKRVTGLEIDLEKFQLPSAAPPSQGYPLTLVGDAGWRNGRGPPGTVRGLTVRQILRRLLDNCDLVQDVAVTDDGSRVMLTATSKQPLSKQPADQARVYDIADLLARPPDGRAARTAKVAAQMPLQWLAPPPALGSRANRAPPAAPTTPQGVRAAEMMSALTDAVSGRFVRFGDRVICIGGQESQRNAQDVLAEERARPVPATKGP